MSGSKSAVAAFAEPATWVYVNGASSETVTEAEKIVAALGDWVAEQRIHAIDGGRVEGDAFWGTFKPEDAARIVEWLKQNGIEVEP